MSHDAPPMQQLIDAARGITDTARGTKYVASDATIRWVIKDVRSLIRQMINIISNDAHSQP